MATETRVTRRHECNRMTQQRKRLMLDCDICGEPVYLSPQRYVELVRAGELPRCRKNGCERLVGARKAGTARTSEVLDVIPVPLVEVEIPVEKKGNANGALAKLRVRRMDGWRWGDGGRNE